MRRPELLTFDEPRHIYHFSGRLVPSVTQVIAPWCDFSMIPPDVLEKARQEGQAIHKMVELICKGLAFDMPEWMRGHRLAFDRFVEDTGFECWAAEKRLYHEIGYAGTADLFGMLPKLRNVLGPANLDIKRSFYGGPTIGLQLAAYSRAWNEEAPKDMAIPDANRFALRLDADGKYRLQRFPGPDDWVDFLAALRQHKFKERHYGSRTRDSSTGEPVDHAEAQRRAAGSSS